MNERPIDHTQRTIFEGIETGMNVLTADGDRLGHVERVYFGADAGSTQNYSVGAAEARNPDIRDNTLVDDVIQALVGSDDLPETLRNRLINDGFIRVKGEGLFRSSQYVLREQIAHVSGDDVHLNVTKDELIKP